MDSKAQIEKRSEILKALVIALENIDTIIEIVRDSDTDVAMRQRLAERFNLIEAQIQAVLDMRLERLKRSEIEKVKAEYMKLQRELENS